MEGEQGGERKKLARVRRAEGSKGEPIDEAATQGVVEAKKRKSPSARLPSAERRLHESLTNQIVTLGARLAAVTEARDGELAAHHAEVVDLTRKFIADADSLRRDYDRRIAEYREDVSDYDALATSHEVLREAANWTAMIAAVGGAISGFGGAILAYAEYSPSFKMTMVGFGMCCTLVGSSMSVIIPVLQWWRPPRYRSRRREVRPQVPDGSDGPMVEEDRPGAIE